MKTPTTSKVDFDLSGISVMLAMPVNRDLPWQTAQSLLDTMTTMNDRRIPFDVQFLVGSSIVQVARSLIAHTFLQSKASTLFMVDSDQSWDATVFIRMLALSTKMPVLLAPYPAKKDPPTFLLNLEDNPVRMNQWGCLPVKGGGLGFTIVHREVMERLASQAPLVEIPNHPDPIPNIFRCDVIDGVFRGEDMAFFSDVIELGYTPFLDPMCQVGHVGAKRFSGNIMDRIDEVQEEIWQCA